MIQYHCFEHAHSGAFAGWLGTAMVSEDYMVIEQISVNIVSLWDV